jgi:hypothetical protein
MVTLSPILGEAHQVTPTCPVAEDRRGSVRAASALIPASVTWSLGRTVRLAIDDGRVIDDLDSTSKSSCPTPRSTRATTTRPITIAPGERVDEEAFAITRDTLRDEKVVGEPL